MDLFRVNFYVRPEISVQIHSLVYGYPIAPEWFVEVTILSPMNGFDFCVKNQVAIDIWVYFWTRNSILLTYMSILMLISHCFDYCNFVVSFEIMKCESSNFVLFQNCFGSSGFLAIPHEFYNQLVHVCIKNILEF